MGSAFGTPVSQRSSCPVLQSFGILRAPASNSSLQMKLLCHRVVIRSLPLGIARSFMSTIPMWPIPRLVFRASPRAGHWTTHHPIRNFSWELPTGGALKSRDIHLMLAKPGTCSPRCRHLREKRLAERLQRVRQQTSCGRPQMGMPRSTLRMEV